MRVVAACCRRGGAYNEVALITSVLPTVGMTRPAAPVAMATRIIQPLHL